MKKWIIFALLGAAVWACGSSNVSDNNTSARATPPPPDGEKLYKQNCVMCHGLSGDMGASGAFNLTTSELTTDERIEVITNGRNAMTPFKALLSPDKIKAVAEYTLSLKE